MKNRLISIDVEPGGYTTPFGAIGITEIIGNCVNASFEINFKSPHYPFSIFNGHAHRAVFQEDKKPDFSEAWPYLDAFIGDDILTAYGYGYDIRALNSLLKVCGHRNVKSSGYRWLYNIEKAL